MLDASAKGRYIAVEGPIGAGKTSLARRLAAHLGGSEMLEEPQHNPFLPGFYQEPARYALSTQLHFLLQRVNQLRSLAQGGIDAHAIVADFMLDKDRLFAAINLDPDELALYEGLYRHIRPQAPAPDLVIYLQASPATLLERVRRRRAEYERGLTLDYLHRLSAAYASFFHAYSAAPVLIVNSDHLNFVDRDADFELLLQRMRGLKGPREYFSLG
ncbi:MAG: deoxynucleoside kinase [Burkholderiales bacterium]|nr:deoxynucleoside kinase [Burkholderiales bacterium]